MIVLSLRFARNLAIIVKIITVGDSWNGRETASYCVRGSKFTPARRTVAKCFRVRFSREDFFFLLFFSPAEARGFLRHLSRILYIANRCM